MGDIANTLPAGVQGPFFNDEFGDVFGLVYAMTGEGFTLPELKHVAEDVREELLRVPGVAKVQIVGAQDERITIAVNPRRLAQYKLGFTDLLAAVQRENSVVAGGFVDTARDRIYVRTGAGLDEAAVLRRLPVQAGTRLLSLADVAEVTRGTVDPPVSAMRFGGKPALGLAVSMADGGNILDLGRAVAARLAEVAPTLPLGVSVARVNDQSNVVGLDVAEFQDSFAIALGIVLVVSFLSLGWRSGLVVAISVPLVLAGVLVGMKLLGIDLQRISLGAMIIALGLLVDDAIIAVETMSVKLEQGWDRMHAGSYAFTSTAFPMLTGTLVTAAGYLPVGLAQSSTGDYMQDIFRVVGLSLVRAAALGGDGRDAGRVCGVSGRVHGGAAAVLPGQRPAGGADRPAAAGGKRLQCDGQDRPPGRGRSQGQRGRAVVCQLHRRRQPALLFLGSQPELENSNYAQVIVNTRNVSARRRGCTAGGRRNVSGRADALGAAGVGAAGRLPGAVPDRGRDGSATACRRRGCGPGDAREPAHPQRERFVGQRCQVRAGGG